MKNLLNKIFGEKNKKTGKCRSWNHKMVYKPVNSTVASNQMVDGKVIMNKYYRDISECSICGEKEYGDLHFGHTIM